MINEKYEKGILENLLFVQKTSSLVKNGPYQSII